MVLEIAKATYMLDTKGEISDEGLKVWCTF